MSEAEQDYYELLGIPRDADEQAIKKAYHRLAMKWHPDRNKAPEAADRFKQIARAYAILRDPKKRARYDAQGSEGVAHFTNEDLFGGLDPADLFADMGFNFGGGGVFDRMFGRRPTRPIHGQDLRVRIAVPLERIAGGGKEAVRVTHPVSCPDCNGHGTRSGKPPPLCAECGGSGRKVVNRDENRGDQQVRFQQVTVCPVCHGRGTRIDEHCESCGGYGQIEKQETLKVTIPVGLEEGSVLRIPAHGLPAEQPETPPGDLYVAVYSQSDDRFQRQDADLWRSETIGISDAVLGTRISVPTLNGTVKVTIPAGTQPDDVLRLAGKGLPRFHGEGKGDLRLRIQVRIPEKISERERALFEQLREAGGR